MSYDSLICSPLICSVSFFFSATHLSVPSHRMSVAAAQDLIDTEMNREIIYLLAANKTVERTEAILTRRREAVRRMRDENARSNSRSRSPESRSRSPKSRPPSPESRSHSPKSRSPSPRSGRGRAPPSSSTGADSYVQRIPFLSRTTRFVMLLNERNVFKARVKKELDDETAVNELK
jgi:hypothetical protein